MFIHVLVNDQDIIDYGSNFHSHIGANELFRNIVFTDQNKSANALALCHPPSASFCSVLAGQWSSRIFTHDRYNILSDILIEFEVNLGIIIERYQVFPCTNVHNSLKIDQIKMICKNYNNPS